MKTKKNLMTGFLSVLLFTIMFTGCTEDGQNDDSGKTGYATVIIAKPAESSTVRSIFSTVNKRAQVVTCTVSVFSSEDNQIYNEKHYISEFPLTINDISVDTISIEITALNNEDGILASGTSVVNLVVGNNNINVPLEWKSDFTAPEGYNNVVETADFSNAEYYSLGTPHGFNPNQSSQSISSSMLYLIKVGKPYYILSSDVPDKKTDAYQLLTDGNADGCFSRTIPGFYFIANESKSVHFLGNWINKYGIQFSFNINFYPVDGFIIEKNSSVGNQITGLNTGNHEEKSYKVKLEGSQKKFLNVSFNYSAVSETDYDLNRFAVIIRDSSNKTLAEDVYDFKSLISSEKYSTRPYKQYRKSFDVSSFDLNEGTIELYLRAGDYTMSTGPAVYVWSDEPQF